MNNSKARWTFMVYMAGDNNLERFGLSDLREMKRIGSSDQVNIVAQFDTMADQVTRRFYLSNAESLDADCVELLPETNTGDPRELENFIKWSASNYSAEHYALVLWNHGSGWKDDDIYRTAARLNLTDALTRGNIRSLRAGKPARTLFTTSLEGLVLEAMKRAILFDDSAADFLDSEEMRQVLQKVQPALDGKLELLGFDACLMNMIEVVCQVQGFCAVVVGSQDVEPGNGWPYDAILNDLVENPDMSGQALGPLIVDRYIDSYVSANPWLAVTQSAVDVESLDPLVAAVDELSKELKQGMQDSTQIGAVFTALRKAQTFTDVDYVDLGDFCAHLAALNPGTTLGEKAAAVAYIITGPASPVIKQKTNGRTVANATGLSIYLPTRVLSPLYGRLQFAQNHHWDEFLGEFVG